MKIGFTVGVWDLLHEGHRNMIKHAKEQCDYLVVGVMTDYWVRVQKGHDRPRTSLEHRIRSVQNLKIADKIIPIDTLDMSQYLQMSDVWILGENQKNMKPFNWEGEKVLIRETPDISTTKIIKDEQVSTGIFGFSDN